MPEPEAVVTTRRDGAVVTFEGVIQDHDHGASVTALDYYAHPETERFRRETSVEVARETGLRVAAAYRVGAPSVGDVAPVASAAAPCRGVRGVRLLAIASRSGRRPGSASASTAARRNG